MKICQIGTGNEFISQKSKIAVELVIFNLSKSLAELGNEVYIIDLYNKENQKINNLSYRFVNLPSFLEKKTSQGTLKHFIKKAWFSIKLLPLLLTLNKEKNLDAIHIQNQFPGFFILFLLKPFIKTKIVYTSHTPFWILPKKLFTNSLILKTLLERICIKLAGEVICVSEAQKKGILEKINVKKEKIKVIKNGVDLKKFHPSAAKKKNKIIILSVARICRTKNQFFSLKAISHIIKNNENIKFVLIGQAEEQIYLDKIKEFIKNQELQDNVEIIGAVDNNIIPDYYRNSDIFLSSSTAEGLPLTVLEAMASGCCIVLSDIPPHKEISKNNEIIFFKSQDIQDLIKKLNLIIKDKELLSSLKKKAFQTAQKFYSWEQVAKSNIEVYRSL